MLLLLLLLVQQYTAAALVITPSRGGPGTCIGWICRQLINWKLESHARIQIRCRAFNSWL
jgi:hypothetical protein